MAALNTRGDILGRTRESQVEDYLCKKIRELGGICEKFVSPSKRGAPDRIAIIASRVIFVEVKADTGQLSKLQRIYHRQITKTGNKVCVVWGKRGVDEFIQWLIDELELDNSNDTPTENVLMFKRGEVHYA